MCNPEQQQPADASRIRGDQGHTLASDQHAIDFDEEEDLEVGMIMVTNQLVAHLDLSSIFILYIIYISPTTQQGHIAQQCASHQQAIDFDNGDDPRGDDDGDQPAFDFEHDDLGVDSDDVDYLCYSDASNY